MQIESTALTRSLVMQFTYINMVNFFKKKSNRNLYKTDGNACNHKKDSKSIMEEVNNEWKSKMV